MAAQVQSLEDQLSPLKEQGAILQAEVSARDAQIKLLEQDNARWKARNEQVLAKYERIDPADLQNLKQEVQELQTALETQRNAVSTAEATISDLQSKASELDAMRTERDSLQVELSALAQESASRAAEVSQQHLPCR